MAISGSLKDVSVADVMQFIHLGRRTGTLLLMRGSHRAIIGFAHNDCTRLDRVPAEKRAINSFSWAIFFSRWAFCPSICERICVFATTMSS